ncbi:hypothetical protein HR09_10755 [Porphyromonas gulae]|nr:hypothetical protein HR09_10755 [Porphyromonas gulae]
MRREKNFSTNKKIGPIEMMLRYGVMCGRNFLVCKIRDIRLEKTWPENFFVLAREKKKSGTKTKTFPLRKFRIYEPQSIGLWFDFCKSDIRSVFTKTAKSE